ncbi:MAG: hypothetical protein H6740_24110 [Alphaproteobacteria bacterium]|nr:hypothetical protein [Alphaproteobacteria bacterium]
MFFLAYVLACVHVSRQVDLDRAGPMETRVAVEREHLPARKVPNPTNSTWRLHADIPRTGPTGYDVVFRPGGTLESLNPRDTTPDNDWWWIDGSEIVVSMNDGFCDYRGVFVDMNTIEGEALNTRGERWSFVMKRVEL